MARDNERGKGAPDWYRYPSVPGGPRRDEVPPKRRAGPRKQPLRRHKPGTSPSGAPKRRHVVPIEVPPERPARPVNPKVPPQVRKFGRLVRRIPRIGNAIDAIGLIDRAVGGSGPIVQNTDPHTAPKLPYNYYWCKGPVVPWPIRYYPDGTIRKYIGPPSFGGVGACNLAVPSMNAGYSSAMMTGNPWAGIVAGLQSTFWSRPYRYSGASNRAVVAGVVQRIGPAHAGYVPPSYKSVQMTTITNPNNDRWMPSPQRDPVFVRGVGTVTASPPAVANPQSAYQPDSQWQYQYAGGSAPGQGGSNGNPAPPNPPPVPPVVREPPGKGERQRKLLSQSAKVGVALYRALDAASEGAEIVDAIYDALPDDVKRRWNRPDRMGDDFGQYGPDGADWKLQALYHNWHKVDVVQAVKNILKNELTDRITGGIHQALPRNAGNAHSQGEKEFNRFLDEWLSEEYGL